MEKMSRVIFPKYTNHHKTLFGGQALKWMDELAYIAVAKRYNSDFVTVKVEDVKFIKPVHENDIVEFCAEIKKEGNVKVEVLVNCCTCNGGTNEVAIEGTFILAAVTNDQKPKRLTKRNGD